MEDDLEYHRDNLQTWWLLSPDIVLRVEKRLDAEGGSTALEWFVQRQPTVAGRKKIPTSSVCSLVRPFDHSVTRRLLFETKRDLCQNGSESHLSTGRNFTYKSSLPFGGHWPFLRAPTFTWDKLSSKTAALLIHDMAAVQTFRYRIWKLSAVGLSLLDWQFRIAKSGGEVLPVSSMRMSLTNKERELLWSIWMPLVCVKCTAQRGGQHVNSKFKVSILPDHVENPDMLTTVGHSSRTERHCNLF
ncbi:unnamed protein product [Soboliphyme baturini]|uniref:DUF3778 domain-containing protein n=1 Tax=Soboliphyme baturini TaxID=241478 RepID=A0A183IDL7_9BILA|nr:unnamed protein product [Soboliphyme baturini]